MARLAFFPGICRKRCRNSSNDEDRESSFLFFVVAKNAVEITWMLLDIGE